MRILKKASLTKLWKTFFEEIASDDDKATYYRGIVYFGKREYDKAIAAFTQAIESDDGNKKDYYYRDRALVYFQKGEYDQAIADFDKAIDSISDDDNKKATYYGMCAGSYFQKGEYDQAIANFTQAIAMASDNEKATYYGGRALVYSQKEEHDKAIADFDKAIESDDEKATYYNDSALVYFGKREYDKAIANFTQAINRTSDDDTNKAIYHSNRAFAYHDKGDLKSAKRDWETSRSIWFTKGQNASKLHGEQIARYRPAENSRITALVRCELWIADPKTFNDPLDAQILQKIIPEHKTLHEMVESVRIASFEYFAPETQDAEQRRNVGRSLDLWGYYADAHKGFCALYTFQDHKNNHLCWREVNYQTDNEILLPVDSPGSLFDSGLLQKREDWKHENELRLLHCITGSTAASAAKPSLILHGRGALIEEAKVGIKLSAIYFGYRMDHETCTMIHAAITAEREEDNITFFQMEEHPKHPHNPLVLIPKPYLPETTET